MSQWAEIRHLHLVEGVPKKEIARRLQLDVKTVRRAVDQPTPPERVSPRPADYLAELVHLEVTGRRERRIQRRIHDARFPMLKTLDAFAFEAQPDLDREAVLAVFDCSFVAEAANVVYVGGVDPAS